MNYTRDGETGEGEAPMVFEHQRMLSAEDRFTGDSELSGELLN